ncbi:MAG TPA: protein kinase, partial [Polyangia bacterium]
VGIVHRDISPSNVLVSFDGGVKIVDFGIAKAAAQGAHTQTGTTKGKVSCMSPEQCRGEAVDRRTDVFALGVLLYELTTGVRPFQGDTEYAIIRQIVDEDAASPTVHRPDYPPALAAIVSRALHRARDQRYATAQELQIDLEAFAQQQGLATSSVELARYMHTLFEGKRPRRIDEVSERFLHQGLPGDGDAGEPTGESTAVPVRGMRRSTLAAAVLSLAVLAGGGYWLGSRSRAAPVVDRGAAAVLPSTTMTAVAPGPMAPVEAAVPTALAPAGAPHPLAAAVPSPPSAATRAPAAAHKRRARTKAAASARAAGRPIDLDAPFPR